MLRVLGAVAVMSFGCGRFSVLAGIALLKAAKFNILEKIGLRVSRVYMCVDECVDESSHEVVRRRTDEALNPDKP